MIDDDTKFGIKMSLFIFLLAGAVVVFIAWLGGLFSENEVQIPAADVRNNIHGVWIYHISDIFPAESTKECSICHAEQCISCDDEFCSHCGADMRGENDEL